MSTELNESWQDWIVQSLSRGCRDEDLVQVMTDNGFEAPFALASVQVTRTLVSRVQPMLDQMNDQKKHEPWLKLNPDNVIDVDGHPVRVAFSIDDPRIALFDNLLSEQECDDVVKLAASKVQRSTVVDPKTGEFVVSGVRRSEGTHFQGVKHPLLDRIEARIASICGISVPQGEPIQVLHYLPGGEYLPHHDYFAVEDAGHAEVLKQGGQRIATMVMYLNDVEAGGDTGFPTLGVKVRPRKGSGIYFEYCTADGRVDDRLLHAGEPVQRGEKWIATKWMRQGKFV